MEVKSKMALVYNYPQHYRESIFKHMDEFFDIDFYFGDYLDWASDIKKMDCSKLKGFKKTLKNKRFFRLFIWQVGAVSAITSNSYKHVILYGDSFYASNWVILLYCRLRGVKVSLWTHGLYKDLNLKQKFFHFPFYKLANYILLYGNYSKLKMIEQGFDEKKLKVIYNSLDYSRQISIREKLVLNSVYVDYFKNNKPVIIYIGRIQKIKRIDMLIDVVQKLKGTEYESNLIIVGEDKEGVDLMSIVKGKGINENVWFYGACYDELKIGELIFNSNLCVSPGNIGLTAMHTLVYGTPAITHRNFNNQMPEFEAIIDGVTGGFFKEDCELELLEQVKYWIKRSLCNRESIRVDCFKIIDQFYNPKYQLEVLSSL